jgi:hypothetical protein
MGATPPASFQCALTWASLSSEESCSSSSPSKEEHDSSHDDAQEQYYDLLPEQLQTLHILILKMTKIERISFIENFPLINYR